MSVETKPVTTIRNERDPKREIRGTVVLGDKDPRKMSKEEFDNSPDRLFHGFSANRFSYDPKFDYESDDYLDQTDGSATLGRGLYATDSLIEAQKYSAMRISRSISQTSEVPANVEIVLPFQAKMIDLRQSEDLTHNGYFPEDVAKGWKEYYSGFVKYLEDGDYKTEIPDVYKFYLKEGVFHKYQKLIGEVIDTGRLDLRYLLATSSSDEFENSLGKDQPYPPWIPLFSTFMKKAGYDGVIYNESGDAAHFNRAPSYVFYNLDKVGTYESWQSGKHEV